MSKLFFSFILNTTCHVTIRSVLNFVYSVAENLANGWAKVTLSMKLLKKILWIADQKVKVIYSQIFKLKYKFSVLFELFNLSGNLIR